jgi:hypothetical protein
LYIIPQQISRNAFAQDRCSPPPIANRNTITAERFDLHVCVPRFAGNDEEVPLRLSLFIVVESCDCRCCPAEISFSAELQRYPERFGFGIIKSKNIVALNKTGEHAGTRCHDQAVSNTCSEFRIKQAITRILPSNIPLIPLNVHRWHFGYLRDLTGNVNRRPVG